MCFDKTGTLTELDIKTFGYFLRENKNFEVFGPKIDFFQDFQLFPEFIKTISLCHALEEINDEILGDPLEVSMF